MQVQVILSNLVEIIVIAFSAIMFADLVVGSLVNYRKQQPKPKTQVLAQVSSEDSEEDKEKNVQPATTIGNEPEAATPEMVSIPAPNPYPNSGRKVDEPEAATPEMVSIPAPDHEAAVEQIINSLPTTKAKDVARILNIPRKTGGQHKNLAKLRKEILEKSIEDFELVTVALSQVLP